MRGIFHIILHFLTPAAFAGAAYRDRFGSAFSMLMATMLVDLDHLLARPIFDPNRCSIGFHPLHTWPAIVFYFLLLFHPKSRMIGIGLLIHMALDQIDCWMMLNQILA